MLIVEPSKLSLLRIRASGWLGAKDYQWFDTEFEYQLQLRSPPVPLLLDLRGFRGWTPAGFMSDLMWDLRNRDSFSKIAVVGSARWHSWITSVGAALFKAPLKYFGNDEEQRAREWLI
jgi:hypothetical protein